MNRHFCLTVALIVFVCVDVQAQVPPRGAENGAAAELVTRVYRVTDLVLETRNYAFSGIDLPGLGTNDRIGLTGAMGGGGMGGGMMGGMGGYGAGGMGGGMGGAASGGGMFSVHDDIRVAQASDFGYGGGGGEGGGGRVRNQGTGLRLTSDDLIQVLTASVQPESWSDIGGLGNITSVAGMLVVLQTPKVHQQISILLDDLRKQGAAVNSLTVRAYWLPSSEIDTLLIDHRQVNRKELAKRIKTRSAVGQISCFDSQTVHLVTGNIRSILTGVIPVVGQTEKTTPWQYAKAAQTPVPDKAQIPRTVLAQFAEQAEGASGDGGAGLFQRGRVGYTPVTKTNVFGGLLQLTASLDPNQRSAILDVHSIVVRPKSEQPAPVDFNNIAKLERLNVVVQQFKTTLRLPINQPVLVGGSTLEPLQDNEARQQLHLIMEVLTDQPPKPGE